MTTILFVPKFVAAISTPGVGVGNCLMPSSKLGVLKIVNFGWDAGKFMWMFFSSSGNRIQNIKEP